MVVMRSKVSFPFLSPSQSITKCLIAKSMVLIYYPKAPLVISILLTCFFAVGSIVAQEDTRHLEKAYYSIIQKAIQRDTMPRQHLINTLQKRLNSGKISKAYMEEVIRRRKIHKTSLQKEMCNEAFKWELEMDLKIGSNLSTVLGKENIRALLKKVGPNVDHNKRTIDSLNIPFSKRTLNGGYFGYAFSAPYLIDSNRYVVYYSHYVAPLNGGGGAIIFCLKEDGSYEIEGVIPLFIS